MTHPVWSESDRSFMARALDLARQAELDHEVPVGAVLVSDDAVVGEGRNRSVTKNDPTAHAEIEAIRSASAHFQNYRLPQTTLYVTLEPCVMCAGALTNARISRLVFATRDIRFGAVRSKFQLADSPLMNHRTRVEEGLCASDSAILLAAFFFQRRS